MKSKLFSPYQDAVRGLVLGLTLFATVLASAQNFVMNPDFEEPLGTNPSNNWTVVYDNCGPFDFLIAGRSTLAHKNLVLDAWDGHDGLGNDWSKLGGHFAVNYCNAMPHAYFRQVITGLPPLSTYVCSAWMVQYTRNDNWLNLAQVYMEVLGGAAGNVSTKTPYVTANANNNPQGWQRYVLTNTASVSGKIEIRLHYKIVDTTAQIWEYRNMNAFYDHVSVIPLGQTEYLPPYNILAFERENQDITWTWETVMNNRYRIQASQNVLDPNSWKMLERELNVDTNFFATGTSYTFRTNIGALFYYNPPAKVPQYFDPNLPLFFRIYGESFMP